MGKPIIEVENLSWRYIGTRRNALADINFKLMPGEVLGVTGPSGAGKTTLTLALNGLIPHNFRGDLKGRVLINGRSTQDISVADVIQEVGLVFQDPETQFMGLSVEEEIVFGLENLGLSDAEISRRIRDAIGIVHMEDFLERSPMELSGGQKQKVAIASALAMQPSLLVLDEPTSELDPIGSEEVFSVMHELKEQHGVAIVLISHATEKLASFCERIILLHEGQQVCLTSPQDLFTDLELLERYGVQPPQVAELASSLELGSPSHWPITLEHAVDMLKGDAM